MIESDRIVTAAASEAEQIQDWAIRPQTFDEYIGQPEVSEQMRLFIKAARGRDEALDHTLIFGPPGLGKTTLAKLKTDELASLAVNLVDKANRKTHARAAFFLFDDGKRIEAAKEQLRLAKDAGTEVRKLFGR